MAATQQQVSCFECFVYQKQMSGTCEKLGRPKREKMDLLCIFLICHKLDESKTGSSNSNLLVLIYDRTIGALSLSRNAKCW